MNVIPTHEAIVLIVWKDGRPHQWRIVREIEKGFPGSYEWSSIPPAEMGDFRLIVYKRPISVDPVRGLCTWSRTLTFACMDGTSMSPFDFGGYKIVPDGEFEEFPISISPLKRVAPDFRKVVYHDVWEDTLAKYKFKVIPPRQFHCETCTCYPEEEEEK